MSEENTFLSDVEVKENEDVFGDTPAPVEEAKEEEDGFKAQNRRERRLLEQNQKLREEAIAYSARLEALKESQTLREGSEEADYLKRIEKIYGNATPEAKEATELLKEALKGLESTATEKALERFEESRGNEAQAVKREEETLDEISERVEDEYGIDFSNDVDRKGYFSLLERLSPKDQDGNIIEYADPDATAELYLSRKEKSASRAKELASRSMTQSGQSQPTKLEDDAVLRYLKEKDLIF